MTASDLAAATKEAVLRARRAGAVVPIVLESEVAWDGGVPFELQYISSLATKDAARIPVAGEKNRGSDPFKPYEAALYVADLSDTHVAILNKFPVHEGHLLLITRDFVDQRLPLGLADWRAAVLAVARLDGLLFYNGGPDAGASQPHRHLHFVPGIELPIKAILPRGLPPLKSARIEVLPYSHVFVGLDPAMFDDAEAAARALWDLVAGLAGEMGLPRPDGSLAPYNLLLARDWLMMIPRVREQVAGISLSAHSFSGLIGLRGREQVPLARAYGPMRMLAEAAGGF